MLIEVLQGSIRGASLFDIFINEIFLFENKAFFIDYADDNVFLCFWVKPRRNKNSFKGRSHKNLQVVYKNLCDSQS